MTMFIAVAGGILLVGVWVFLRRKQMFARVFPPVPEEKPPFAFCEGVGAHHFSKWHIRRVPDGVLKLGGGITTPSLCGFVRVVHGWDVKVRISEGHLGGACQTCVDLYRQLKADS